MEARVATLALSQYRQLISSANPGLILILVDQSESMKERYGAKNESKAAVAASAVNQVIYEIQQASQSGQRIRDRCFVGVVGYGEEVKPVVGGMISVVAESPREVRVVKRDVSDGKGGLSEIDLHMPIWVQEAAANGTPMAEAFDTAADLIEDWIGGHPNSFPPVVINITDGMPNDLQQGGDGSATRAAVQRLMQLETSDGPTLLFNAHISSDDAAELIVPATLPASADQFAQFLFSLSSLIPRQLAASAVNAGFNPQSGSRAFAYNAKPETLIRLITFGSASMLR
jgi:hypothetical protein